METLVDAESLAQHRQGNVLVMFGGADCSVCQAMKPKIEQLLEREFPELHAVYLDCHGQADSVCAQEGVFTLPLVQLWFDGKKFAEFSRVFAIGQVRDAIARPYEVMYDSTGS